MHAVAVAWFQARPDAARRIRWLLVAFMLAAGAVVGSIRGANVTKFDFRCFYKDAASLAGGTDLTQSTWLEWYPPGFRVMLVPLGRLSVRDAAFVWNLLNLAAALVTLAALSRIISEYNGDERSAGRREFVALSAFLLVLPLILFNFHCNQISLWPLAFLSLGLLAAVQRRWTRLGVWLGMAIFIKVLPALLIGWCVLRRRFASAIVAVGVPAVLSFGIDGAVNGPAAARRHHVHWFRVCVSGGSGADFLEQGNLQKHQNQGLAAVLARLLGAGPPDTAAPLSPEFDRPLRPVNFAALESSTIQRIYQGVMLVSLAALAVVTLRAGGDSSSEFGLLAIWCVAIIWFAPLARQYYEVWALPALYFLADRLWRHRLAGTSAAVCNAALLLWAVGLVGWAVPELRAIGMNQWVNLAVMAAVAAEVFAGPASANGGGAAVRYDARHVDG